MLCPGVIDSCSNYIEHPKLIAERLLKFADIVGRERVLAGSDCGFSTFAGDGLVDPDICFAKFEAMAEGCRDRQRQALGELSMADPIDILLVHGSWHGGWAWDGIAEPLRARGHRVLAPCLKGLGSDAANLAEDIGLHAHVDQLETLVREQDLQDFLLVGHSYGGALAQALEPRIADRLHAVVHHRRCHPRARARDRRSLG